MSHPLSLLAEGALLQSRYRIGRLIGKGGMGAVYEARDERLGHIVALKQNFYGADEQLKHAFEREARLLANLKHHSLPRVTDYFTEDFGQFLVMEFIAGRDLLSLLNTRGSAFSSESVLRWADQLLDALDYLHTQQPPIIHRDIKPQNLKLTPKGDVMLLDFGLAKGTTAGLTSVMAGSSIVGFTPGYAPLEQVTAKGTDARSDLYSLAATLYHLLTNLAPPDAMARLGETTNDEPDPLKPAAQVNAQVPVALSNLLLQAMAQKRNDRPADAKAMRRALKQRAAVADESTRVRQTNSTVADQPSAGARSAKPKLVVEFSTPPPVKPEAAPPTSSKMPVKFWAIVVAGLYMLALIGLTWPTIVVLFWPLPGPGQHPGNLEGWPDFSGVFLFKGYWIFLGILLLSQFALLKVPVQVTAGRTLSRRSIILPTIVSGLMICVLAVGALLSVVEFANAGKGDPPFGFFLSVAVLTWTVWAIVFFRLSREQSPEDLITRQARAMLKGSILELLVAVPTHIVARARDYCCAGFMTFIGITLGIAVMLISFGPGVYFLFVERWKRLHRYREPVEKSPSP